MPERRYILRYQYVPDIEQRRGEHRAAHLDLIGRYHADGRILMAGAVGDPVTGGLFVLRDAEAGDAFAAEDPYVKAGLVVERSVEPWNVVT
jgi:uncharacterized protein YciI